MPGVGLLNSQGTGNTISDYTYPMIVDLAKSVSTDDFHVWVVPTVDIFKDHPEYFYAGDNLHANTAGETKIAEAIWKVMKDNCVGQAAAGGCCMP
jgi:lysophospholipase L1-like esterase